MASEIPTTDPTRNPPYPFSIINIDYSFAYCSTNPNDFTRLCKLNSCINSISTHKVMINAVQVVHKLILWIQIRQLEPY